jgi:hypothetical protein
MPAREWPSGSRPWHPGNAACRSPMWHRSNAPSPVSFPLELGGWKHAQHGTALRPPLAGAAPAIEQLVTRAASVPRPAELADREQEREWHFPTELAHANHDQCGPLEKSYPGR